MQHLWVAIAWILRRHRKDIEGMAVGIEGRDFGNVVLKKNLAENSKLKMIKGERAIGGAWY